MALRRAFFWLTVAGVSMLSPVVLNLAADRFPQAQGLTTLNDYVTRRNG